MCCSQVLLLKESSSREEARLVALTTFYFLWIRNPGRGQSLCSVNKYTSVNAKVVCKMCCSQVLLKESRSREEERAAFLRGSGRGAHFGGWHESGGPTLATGKFERNVEISYTPRSSCWHSIQR